MKVGDRVRLSDEGFFVLRPGKRDKDGTVSAVIKGGTSVRVLWDGARVSSGYYAAKYLEVMGPERFDPLPPDLVKRFAHVQRG